MWHYTDHKSALVNSMRAETRRQRPALFNLCWEHAYWDSNILLFCTSVSDYKSMASMENCMLITGHKGLPGGSAGKESTCNVGDLGSTPGLGRSPGGGKGYPLAVFWPGEFHGLFSPWGHKESDTTEQLSLQFSSIQLFSRVQLFVTP